MPYKVWATNDVPTAADANAVTADPGTAEVTADQTTTGQSYADLTTVGPSVTLTLTNGQTCLVMISCNVFTAAQPSDAWASFAVSGATTLAAADANGGRFKMLENNADRLLTRATIFTATASGSHTFTMKYKVTTFGAGEAHFAQRRIIVKKF